VNPRIGSGMQQGREVTEEQTVEVVQNHEDGTPSGNWRSHSEGRAEPRNSAAMRRWRCDATPGRRTPRLVRWRGDLWTTPREETRLCGRVARTGTRRESRRQGQEGRANLCANAGERAGRRSSRAEARRRASRPRRAAVNGQGAATSIGILPPAGGTCRCGAWRGPCPGAKRGIDTRGSLLRQQVPRPAA